MTYIAGTQVSSVSEKSPLSCASTAKGSDIEYIDLEFVSSHSLHTGCELLVCGELNPEYLELISDAVGALHEEGERFARRLGAESNYEHITNQCLKLSSELTRRVIRAAQADQLEVFEGGLWGVWGLKERHPQMQYPKNWTSPYDHFVNHYLSALRSETGGVIAIDCSARRYVMPSGKYDALVFSHHDEQVLRSMLLSYYGGPNWDLRPFCSKD